MTRDDFDSEEEYQGYLLDLAQREARKRREKEELEAYLASPAIKRLELWHSRAAGLPIGQSFQLLGEALREWAQEEQRKSK